MDSEIAYETLRAQIQDGKQLTCAEQLLILDELMRIARLKTQMRAQYSHLQRELNQVIEQHAELQVEIEALRDENSKLRAVIDDTDTFVKEMKDGNLSDMSQ